MTEVDHRCAVLGKPIAHSLSPVLHNAAYRALGLDSWSYGRHEVGETELEDFLESLDSSWAGTEPDHAVEEDHPAIWRAMQRVGERAEGGQHRRLRLVWRER